MKKVIVVTGATSGIGKATALQLIKKGYSVYGTARRVEKKKDIVAAKLWTLSEEKTPLSWSL